MRSGETRVKRAQNSGKLSDKITKSMSKFWVCLSQTVIASRAFGVICLLCMVGPQNIRLWIGSDPLCYV